MRAQPVVRSYRHQFSPELRYGHSQPTGPEVLTLSSTHLSKSLRSLNSHRSPEDVMQKVLSAFFPRPQATSVNRLFRSSPSSPERPSRGTVAFTCGDIYHCCSPIYPRAHTWKPGPPGSLRLFLGTENIWLIQNFCMAADQAERCPNRAGSPKVG